MSEEKVAVFGLAPTEKHRNHYSGVSGIRKIMSDSATAAAGGKAPA